MSSTAAKKEQRIDFLGKSVRLITADSVPEERTNLRKAMIESLNRIPKGGAIAGTRDELGRSYSAIKVAIQRLKKDRSIPDSIYSATRKVNGKEMIYIVNRASKEEN